MEEDELVSKSLAIYQAIKNTPVGDNIVIHNSDGSIWCVLKKVCEETEY